MPPVEAFSVSGLDLRFYSDDHWPPHVRKPGTWEIRVYILTTTESDLHFDAAWPKKSGVGPTGAQQRSLRRRVADHRAELLVEWDDKVRFDPPSAP